MSFLFAVDCQMDFYFFNETADWLIYTASKHSLVRASRLDFKMNGHNLGGGTLPFKFLPPFKLVNF